MIKKWFKEETETVIKTMPQAGIAMIGTSVVIEDVSWQMVVSAAVLAGILSLLTSLAGLPEVEQEV